MVTQPPVDAREMPLLQTKFYIPPLRREQVPRPRLSERLDAGLGRNDLEKGLGFGHNYGFARKLTLVSAPAGFGKTTLVSEWLHAVGGATPPIASAWLSLDEGDNDLTRFLTHFVVALQTKAQQEPVAQQKPVGIIGQGALSALESPQPPPTEAILTTLINEIAATPGQIVLALDDYHVIESPPVDDALTFLLDHLPPQMHIVIATRDDPHLPLARLRARGQLTELRAPDLRFTSSEAAEFLNQVMGLNLSAKDIAALETRTEGWITGLQLAALALQGTMSMQGRKDTTDFIKSFTGSHRFVLDYLIEEVLEQQSESVQTFMLQTAILERLNGSLCDAVCSVGTGVRFGIAETPSSRDNGQETLEMLERGNLFIVPLDDERQWYRYHHLFADLLRQRLHRTHKDQLPTLHSRASKWYEQNGFTAEAVEHALRADDFERAADLVELAWPAMEKSYIQSATWHRWVKALPDELVRSRPVLSMGYAWGLLDGGELEAAEARLRDAERWLESITDVNERPGALSAEMVVRDEEQFRSLPTSIATARAYHAQALGDVPSTIKYTRRVLDLLPQGDYLRRGQAASLLGLAYWASGDLEAAQQSFADFMAITRIAGDISEAIGATFVLADIEMTLGRLHEASSTYQQSLQLAAGLDEPISPGKADLYRGMSELYLEQGDLQAATQHLLTGKKLGEQAAQPDWQRRLCVTEARIKEAQGDLDGALDLLDEAQRLHIRTPLPDVRPIAALKTRIWVAQGRLAEALGWVRERGLSVDDDLSYLREFEHITLARALIAQYVSDRTERSILEAIGLLERLLKAAEGGKRMGSVLEILALQALAHQAHGDVSRALKPLKRALILAGPQGYVHIFVDKGPSMAALLREAAKHGVASNHVSKLRAAFGKTEGKTPVSQLLIEPLSERELEVLGLLRTELSGPEIARELVVSLNTMRTHTKNIYSKLRVNNRRAAVRRAEELGLF